MNASSPPPNPHASPAALVAMSHAHMAGGAVSEESERNIVIGNAEALPASLFPESVAYVALGHLHKPQQVAGQARIRYSGSPLPLSFAEDNYPHQVLLVELDGEQLAQVESLPVPRAVEMIRIGRAPLAEIITALEACRPPVCSTTTCPGWRYACCSTSRCRTCASASKPR